MKKREMRGGRSGSGGRWGRGERDRQMDRYTEGALGVTTRLAG